MLKIEANAIVESLEVQPIEALKEAPEVIENIRLRHADLCHVISRANQFLSHILAAFYGTGMTCILLVIHGLINNEFTIADLVNMGSLSFSFVFYLVVITTTGAALNMKMHEPVDFLFRLDVQRMTGKGTEIVSTFLSRLQGAPIGFHVYNLFTVDTSTVMMICGTILTYVLVIVQFKPGANVQCCASSSTDQALPVTLANTQYPAYANTTDIET
ncbi:hypothetical protein V1264_016462 [Littorina saxatilis]